MDFSDIFLSPLGSVICVLLSTLCLYFWYIHRNVPPGPRGLPFLGYAPFFGLNPQTTFLQLGKKYGNIFSLYMGPQLTIVLNDYQSIRAAYSGQGEVFSGRADGFVFRHISTGADGKVHGITLQEGEVWKTERRFMLQTFRDLGMGKAKLQDRILEEADYLTDIFGRNDGRSFDPFPSLFSSVSNIICALCFGKRFEHEDPEFLQILADLRLLTVYLAQAGPMSAYPVLRFLPGRLNRMWKSLQKITKRNQAFVRDMIEDHKSTYTETDTRDYIDAFLHEQRAEMQKPNGPSPAFHDEELMQNLRAFFGAGTETTSVTLQWALLYMLHHPQVQKKIHQELDEAIGAQNSVTIEDRVKLPYLEAVCREVQRLANVAPFGVLRANLEETTLLGYRIPKRCYIMPNYLAVNIDPSLWKDPLTFNPERFLDSQGKLFEPPHFMPFSIGKRACVGESLARMEIFLFFANIMQRFQIRKAENSHIPSTSQFTTGISCRPFPFEIEAISRR